MQTLDVDYYSDRGDRENNEDRAAFLEGGRVCAVADGMGGMRGGETASRLAVEAVRAAVDAGLIGTNGETDGIGECLQQVVDRANRSVLDACGDRPYLLGMGTTLTLTLILGWELFFAHIGDSRLYLWREGNCQLLTEDHTQMQELVRQGRLTADAAAGAEYRHTLVRYIGTVRQMKPQLGRRELQAGDRLLICSDGLHGELEAASLQRLLGEELPASELARKLVERAKRSRSGQLDNITALVMRVATSPAS